MPVRYAELRARSCFSFLEGASQPEELVGRAAELGLSALALADVNGLYGIVRAHAEARRRGLPLVVGVELAVQGLVVPGRPARLVLLAVDREGYASLCRLTTLAHCGEGWTGAPARRERSDVAVSLEQVADRARGIFALYPGADEDAAARLREAFGPRLALAVARHRVAGEEARVRSARAVGRRLGIPVAVTNDVHTHERRRQALQDVLACVRLGTTLEKAGRRLFPNAERTLKGPDEMLRLWRDFPEGLEIAADIADRCRFRMDEIRGEHPLPPVVLERGDVAPTAEVALSSPAQSSRESAATPRQRLRTTAAAPAAPGDPPPAASDGAGRGIAPPAPASEGPPLTERTIAAVTGMPLLRELVREGARWRYGAEPPEDVRRQLARELDLVEALGYASYFLTVWDVVRFARERGILCQGRGSAANSAVCYVLGITSIDPVRMGLLFERFISAERGEPPDIDVDFEHERREEVLQYVYARYGRDRAGMVCEVITYRGRSALRDVGKALGLSLAQVDRLAKLAGAYEDLGRIGPEQLAHAGLDGADSERVRLTLELARALQGFPRHLSIHVGGFVVTRRPLCETAPIEPAAMPGRTIVQWDKDDLAELDLLKVDLLALGMLTALSRSLALLARHRPAPAAPTPVPHPDSLATIPAEDPSVYEMLSRADSIGVFQVESRAQMSLAPRLRPRSFYDLVISVAIIRPGPIQGGMIHPYLRRRDGREAVRYPYPPLEPVLARTLGVPLFQEQAMRIAVIAAGFTPGEADELRRVMTHHRSHEKLAAMKARLVAGMAERGVSGRDAEQIFEQLLGFAGYGFPESHAASFALLVYASAWLKRYHPAAFACALLNSQPMGFYAPHTLIEDAKRHGIEVRGVDVAASDWESSLEGAAPGRPCAPGEAPALRIGLHAIRGLPRAVGDALLAARAAAPFASLADLVRRARLSRAWLVRLAEAGALGALAPDRRGAIWRSLAVEADGGDLFAGVAPPEPPPALPAATAAEEVSADFAATGLSVRGHPMAVLRPGLGGGRLRTARELARLPDRAPVEVAGLVIVRQRPETAGGIVFVSLEDETGIANLVLMPDVYERFRPVVRAAPFLLARGRVERSGQVVNVRVDSVAPLALAPAVGDRARDFR
ncbi:error-prone DNA polymerase [Anaeromyxobacter oryzisoli]|uniref:error-prone DNA polymerase n=1 Tax=Anaeromyxobacter oryzisoli TaxID=2925408 RepID=UPI001F564740|nr:error-prone DNA polymerase [Anaeromyxobacter sp. SG63]